MWVESREGEWQANGRYVYLQLSVRAEGVIRTAEQQPFG